MIDTTNNRKKIIKLFTTNLRLVRFMFELELEDLLETDLALLELDLAGLAREDLDLEFTVLDLTLLDLELLFDLGADLAEREDFLAGLPLFVAIIT